MRNYLSIAGTLILMISVGISCSSIDPLKKFTSPPHFDESAYIDPNVYYNLSNSDTTKKYEKYFTPVTIVGGRRKAQSMIDYPRGAYMNDIEGSVIIQIFVDSTATLTKMNILKSPHELLSKAAKRAVLKMKFNPATLNGKPINSYMSYPFHFATFSIKLNAHPASYWPFPSPL